MGRVLVVVNPSLGDLMLRPTLLVAALALLPAGARGQFAGPQTLAVRTISAGRLAEAIDGAVLSETYHVRLVSAWPQLTLPDGSCNNGGEEQLEGTLVRDSSGRYRGVLTRSSTISFCGSHGPAREACSMTLSGAGSVNADVVLLGTIGGWGDHPVRMHWTPNLAETTTIVTGDCPGAFTDKLVAMYTSARHSLEFALPAGVGSEVQQLEEYGWVVEVRSGEVR
jgi:hypothetical protein